METSSVTQNSLNPETRITTDTFGNFLREHYFALWLGLTHHKTHKNKHLTLAGHQYLKAILMDKSPYLCVEKSTQCGVSEILIVLVMEELIHGRSVFYVLPTYDIMSRFVSNRFEKSLAYTPYYKALSRGGEFRKSDNKSLKDIGGGVISFAGSNTPVPFTEFPADVYVVDEKDRCHQDHIHMGKERMGHAEDPRIIEVSNPTITEFAIDETYQESDKKKWSIKCSSCGEYLFPDFFNHIVMEVEENTYIIRDESYDPEGSEDILPICDQCGKPFDRYADGEHVPEFFNKEISGYQISKLFSGTMSIKELVSNFNGGLSNDFKMQRFYNSDLGLPFIQAGAKITKNILDACIRNYSMPDSSVGKCVMGVDVGKVLHVRINEILDQGRRAVYIGIVNELKDLFSLVKRYNVLCAVIDALPETRLSKSFANSFIGGFRCFFGSARRDLITPRDKMVTVDRTQLLDTVKEEFLLEKIFLPKNAGSIDEYYDHMQASTRIYDETREVYRWEEGNKADHFFLAEGYCSLAFKLLKVVTR